ncbi:gp12 [Burkholderia phage BcepC6B]|uniref:Gp12 n=1 Tax=Burkholderia phage BcepC6B TaxID=2883949 RepID=Q6J1R5_9CAUD|nr:tail protein [Burkholderia phage BcepC6B]AAT38371.1 gp12 [Burkholderia phage BcepC6B]
MPKAAPQQVSFDAGELSPLLGARVDLAKYPNGCQVMENFIATVQGPAIRRGGKRFVAATKDSTKQSWLLPFIVADGIAYMLEFGDHYIRFFVNRGQLVNAGAPVEIATPYALADLTTEDGTFAIRATQSADTMYLFHGGYPTQKLLRTSATTFSLQPVTFVGGPFAAVNSDNNVRVHASAGTGAVTLVASASVFRPSDVGTLFYLEQEDNSFVKPWVVHQKIGPSELRRVGDRVYLCTAVGTATPQVTGTETPTHTSGSRWDGTGQDESATDEYGSIGAEWEYQHSGYGTVLITGYTNDQVVTGTVATNDPADPGMLPNTVVTLTGTYKWARSLFNSTDGFPQMGTFWRNRLCLMRDRWLAMSVSADFETFKTKDADQQTDDSAIVQQLNARQLNKLAWMVESDSLLIGMTGDEWVIGPANASQPVSAANLNAARRTSYGSKRIQPVQVGGTIMFVQKAGRKLRDFKYDFSSDNYVSTDVTKIADHITRGRAGTNSGIMSLCFQQEPHSVVWAARADGQLIGCTYDEEAGRSDVYGWHRHPDANGFVECVASMPAPDGASDDLWVIVRRQVNGQTVRYVEYLNPALQDDEPQSSAFYVDAGITYNGVPTSTIAGLGHLEGVTVAVLTDGAVHPSRTVTAGAITLDWSASIVHIGVPTTCRIQTMQLNAGAANGTAQGKTKRVTNIATRFSRSLGGVVGPTFDDNDLEQLSFRKPSNAMDRAVPLFDGDMESDWRGGYEGQSWICYQNDQPLPVTLLGFFPILDTQDDR